jgi:crossover junction endodeoxyribonuclease RusA
MKEITLPWPPSALSPNARVHWSKKSKMAKEYRRACFDLTIEAVSSGFSIPKSDKLSLWIDFYPPDRRKRDDDNCISSFKNGRDGLAQALGIDDSKFRTHPYVMDQIGGFIKVRITTTPSKQDT